MRNLYILSTLGGLCLLSFLVGFQMAGPKSKVAFVKTGYLLEHYRGMKELNLSFQKAKAEKQQILDSLDLEYKAKVTESESGQNETGKNELKILEYKLYSHRQQFGQELEKEKEILTQGVLNQVNAYVEQYAEKNGYELILGTTSSGNILYGTKTVDITEEVLEYLNSEYRKK